MGVFNTVAIAIATASAVASGTAIATAEDVAKSSTAAGTPMKPSTIEICKASYFLDTSYARTVRTPRSIRVAPLQKRLKHPRRLPYAEPHHQFTSHPTSHHSPTSTPTVHTYKVAAASIGSGGGSCIFFSPSFLSYIFHFPTPVIFIVPTNRHTSPPNPTEPSIPILSFRTRTFQPPPVLPVPPGYTVKLDSRETPPPLHFSPAVSDHDRSSTAETTPIGTPRGFGTGTAFPRKGEKEKENLFAWPHRNTGFAGNTSSFLDSTLLESDFEDSTFPLFDEPSGPLGMGSRTTPIDIAIPSQHIARNMQTSNLTTALQATRGNESRSSSGLNVGAGQSRGAGSGFGHRDSVSGGMSGSHSGAQPISMNASNREKPRRESLAGSMVTGMSWGGASVGSWIRDDIIMQGTSPFPYQSPSFHSSSYLPKLEANFMRDFSCCGLTLPSLHELLQHYEENHAQQIPQSLQKQNSNPAPMPDPKAAIAAGAAAALKDPSRGQQQQAGDRSQGTNTPRRSNTPTQQQRTPQQAQQTVRGFAPPAQPPSSQDEDTVGDMEMDDDFSTASTNMPQSQYQMQDHPRMMQRNQFGQPSSGQVPPLDLNTLNMGNQLQQQHQGLRNSTPTTPVSSGRNGNFYQNNPTVSSVNTPTLSAHPSAHPLQQQFYTPDSSAPGTPGELDGDFVGTMGNMNMGSNMRFMQTQPYGGYGYGNGNEMLDLCIDEPAKRLFAVGGGQNNPPQASTSSASQLGDGQYSENSELARTIREQQKLAGVPDPSADGVAKPFHCPVIGCEKAYKNQNGLKYHKSHGHNTQKLAANENGTFSIVDPETLNPYPGTMGMEKHKPYRCDTCGKRYKNLNGLKYHKNHSPNCESEIQNPYPHPPKEEQLGEGDDMVM